VIFFRKDPESLNAQVDGKNTAVVSNMTPTPATVAPSLRPVPARDAVLTKSAGSRRQHTVQPGETLFSLAQRYYGDGDKFVELYRLNRDVLQTPDPLPAGVVLTVPDLPDKASAKQQPGEPGVSTPGRE
jgi:nucleoid-associated protein YgaU